MGPTVCLTVQTHDVDHTDLGYRLGDQVHLCPDQVAVEHCLVPGEERHLNRAVGCQLGVAQLADAILEIRRQLGQLEVHAGLERLHVSAGNRPVPLTPDHTAQDVHGRVGPHQLPPSLVVYLAGDDRADCRNRSGQAVQHLGAG